MRLRYHAMISSRYAHSEVEADATQLGRSRARGYGVTISDSASLIRIGGRYWIGSPVLTPSRENSISRGFVMAGSIL